MNRCSWLLQGVQCENTSDGLVCEKCEPEKSLLYSQYKEAEKTVISAIHNSLPRGDLLEARKVIGRINRVVKLRRKFTSRLAPQSRDVGHEYHVSLLLEKLKQYQDYISNSQLSSLSVEDDENTENSHMMSSETREHQRSITKAIQEVVKSDPFEKYDSTIQLHQQNERDYLEFLREMEKLTGYSGDNLELVITFIGLIKDCITTAQKYLSRLVTGRYIIEFNFTKLNYDISLLSHQSCIAYMQSVVDSNLLSYTDLTEWIVTHVKYSAKICCKAITVDKKNTLVMFLRIGKIYSPILFGIRFYLADDGEYDAMLNRISMTPDIHLQIQKKDRKSYRCWKIKS